MTNLHAVIIAGGSGTRFWPASRRNNPKQLLPLIEGRSLLEKTLDRLQAEVIPDRTWIVTNAEQAEAIGNLLPDFPRQQIIIEPEARDTAPCIALACARIGALDDEACIAIMPADHLIEPVSAFHLILRRGLQIAEQSEVLVTFGITPDRPATGYGYIERGQALDPDQPMAYRVERFREKPDLETAREYLASGKFFWNSGIFMWTGRSVRKALRASAPELAECTEAMLRAVEQDDVTGLRRAFLDTPKTSIDYALLEKANEVAVVEARFDWDDLGSFAALDAIAERDASGNITVLDGGAQLALLDSQDCTSFVRGMQTLALMGTRDLLVVAVEDAILVCPKSETENIKRMVQKLRQEGRTDLL